MKWKLFRRQLTVSSPKMAVRPQMSGALRAVISFLMLAAAAAAGVAIYEYGRHFAGPDRRELAAELERTQSQVRELTAERERLAAVATSNENLVKIERAAQEQLLARTAALESENARLKEDLAFFESLLPASNVQGGVAIRSFRLQPEPVPNQYRFRLLVQQTGKPERDFVGSVQLQVNFSQGGRNWTLTLPPPDQNASDPASRLELSFRHYQRVEGPLTLPEGAAARSAVVRIIAGGKVVSQQAFNL